MRELTIADIKGLENGEYIPSFCATIEKVYEQKRGEGNYGAWSLQNMIVKDETGKVQATWGGEDDLSELEGQTRIFQSSQTKHGLRGCRWEVKTKNGTRYESVKLTDTCKIKPLSNGGERQPSEANISAARRDDPPPQTNVGGAPAVLTANDRITGQAPKVDAAHLSNGINEARQRIMQDANLMLIAMEGARYVAQQWQERHDCELPNEHFQALCHCFFIEVSSRRTTDGVNWWSYVDRMPIKPVHNGNEKVERPPITKEEESEVPF